MRLKSFQNEKGLNSVNQCCTEKDNSNVLCQGSCKTRFKVCLKQYQAEVDPTSICTFGAAATSILGDNSFNFTSLAISKTLQQGSSTNLIRFPFEFVWPVSIQHIEKLAWVG